MNAVGTNRRIQYRPTHVSGLDCLDQIEPATPTVIQTYVTILAGCHEHVAVSSVSAAEYLLAQFNFRKLNV